ncbi:MAG: ATPase, partial [Saprospiraceae bacterium]|nr:ATPase [Saprospiraceae bacterium]
DRSGLHPLTCLTTITKKEKQLLLDQGLVLCRELYQDLNHLRSVGVSQARLGKIGQEVRLLCESE